MAGGLELEDEEIVLEDSPLYQHLRETGFLETDIFQLESSKEKCSEVPLVENYLPFYCCLKSCFKELLLYPLNIFSNLYQQVRSSYLERERNYQKEVEKKLLSCMLSNDVLIEDYKAFLKNFSQDDELTSGSDGVSSISTFRFYWFLALFIIFLSYIWKRLHPTVGEKEHLFRCGLELFLVIIFLVTMTVILKEIFNKYWSQKALEDGKRRINQLISSTTQTNELLKKCILIVQEAELIARGFTLASVTIPASRLETSKVLPLTRPERQCPELRKSIFHWTKSLFQSFRMATLELQKLVPLQKELDRHSCYIAATDLQEFGPLLCQENSDPDNSELLEVTENYCVSSLKAIHQLMRVQQSEFLCRLSLIFLKDALPSSRAKESALKRLKVTRDVLEKLYLSNMETLNVLYKTHHYHRSLKMVQVSERERKPYESEHSSVKSLCVTIHSLILHLQAALLRVKTIEEHVDEVHKESVKSAGQNESLLSLVNDELHTMDGWLDEVSAEIQASSDCVSQSQMLIKQILGIKMNSNLETSIQDSGLHNNKQRTEKVEIIDSAPSCLHIGDPMIEDQVFEAYIDESEKSHNLISDSFFLSEHDRVKKKQELETSTRLFKELCSVLVVRKEGCRQKELDGPLAREKNDSALPDKSNRQDVINAEDFVVLQSSVDEVEKEDKIISRSCSFEDKKMTKIKNFQDQSCEHLLNNEQNVESKSDDFNSDSIKNTCKSKGFSPSYNIPSEKENSRTDEILKLKVPGVSDGNLFFTKTVAALAAERSKLFGLSGQTVLGESEECFEDSDNNSDCENIS